MSTLKSLLPQAFAVSDVHPRLRKCLSRCTLDCGFKTPESPALRGFEAERCPITGTSLYLVLLSNGLHPSENLPVKFGFSLKIVPATIAKKLPLQLRPKPFFIAFFNFSHKWPTFAFAGESGYTLGFRRRIAHSGLHAETGGVSDGGGITTLGAFRTFTNIPGPGVRTANFAAFGPWSGVLPKNAESLRDSDALMRVAVPRHRGPAGPRDFFRFCRNFDLYILHSGFSACARQGRYHYPRRAPHVLETLDGRLSKRLICRFLRLLSSILCAVPFSANMQISLSAISVANAFPPPTTAGLCAASRIASNRTTTVSLGCMDSSSFGCLIVLDSSSTYTTRS